MTKLEGSALDNLMESGQTTWNDKVAAAAAQLEYDLRNRVGLDLSLISTKDSDGNANNVQADINHLNAVLALAIIYEDNIENVGGDTVDQYIRKADKYMEQYKTDLDVLKLDYDTDESGDIGETEEDGTIEMRMSV